ncbi:MAG: AAA family ATPase [Candidatus Aenigmarchaeota archaeon]|nr:AAA family ATPase [Candidatus Aenigmarchaeota archaeon]
MTSERIKTGLKGLDKLIEGGFVKKSCVLLSGETGTGKTIFGFQFLKEGIENNENGLYITLEQLPDEIHGDMERFGWDYKKNSHLVIEHIEPSEIERVESIIAKQIIENDSKRVVIDSLTLIGSYVGNAKDIRRKYYNIVRTLKKTGCTALLISEIPEGKTGLSRFEIGEFLVDGVIQLKCGVEVVGGKPRSLIVRKMRRTNHDLDVHPIEISKKGMKLSSK